MLKNYLKILLEGKLAHWQKDEATSEDYSGEIPEDHKQALAKAGFANENGEFDPYKHVIIPVQNYNEIDPDVHDHLEDHGYTVLDDKHAIKNVAPTDKKVFKEKIANILEQTGASKELKRAYINDPNRVAGSGQSHIVISPSPIFHYAASTNQGWKSCMTKPGSIDPETGREVDRPGMFYNRTGDLSRYGALTAYSVNSTKEKIEKDLADNQHVTNAKGRLTCMPYRSENDDHTTLVSSDSPNNYGQFTNQERDKVDDFLSEHFPQKENIEYKLEPVYGDENPKYITGEHRYTNAEIHDKIKNGSIAPQYRAMNLKDEHFDHILKRFSEAKDDISPLKFSSLFLEHINTRSRFNKAFNVLSGNLDFIHNKSVIERLNNKQLHDTMSKYQDYNGRPDPIFLQSPKFPKDKIGDYSLNDISKYAHPSHITDDHIEKAIEHSHDGGENDNVFDKLLNKGIIEHRHYEKYLDNIASIPKENYTFDTKSRYKNIFGNSNYYATGFYNALEFPDVSVESKRKISDRIDEFQNNHIKNLIFTHGHFSDDKVKELAYKDALDDKKPYHLKKLSENKNLTPSQDKILMDRYYASTHKQDTDGIIDGKLLDRVVQTDEDVDKLIDHKPHPTYEDDEKETVDQDPSQANRLPAQTSLKVLHRLLDRMDTHLNNMYAAGDKHDLDDGQMDEDHPDYDKGISRSGYDNVHPEYAEHLDKYHNDASKFYRYMYDHADNHIDPRHDADNASSWKAIGDLENVDSKLYKHSRKIDSDLIQLDHNSNSYSKMPNFYEEYESTLADRKQMLENIENHDHD